MTDNEIKDKLAELMGWRSYLNHYIVPNADGMATYLDHANWNPLERIADAWMLVEKMVTRMGYDNPDFEWQGPIFKPEHRYLPGSPLDATCWYVMLLLCGRVEWVCAATAPRAITLAALKACGVEVSE